MAGNADQLTDSLTGLPSSQGGLLVRPDKRHSLTPRVGTSQLGLDRLAAEKAKERAAAGDMAAPRFGGASSGDIKRPRLSHLDEEYGEVSSKSRQYRRPKVICMSTAASAHTLLWPALAAPGRLPASSAYADLAIATRWLPDGARPPHDPGMRWTILACFWGHFFNIF